MKYIKQYEESLDKTDNPHTGDYVISDWTFRNIQWSNYINSNIGRIIEVDNYAYHTKYMVDDYIYNEYFLKHDGDLSLIKKDKYGDKYIIMNFKRNKIKEFAPTEEELEIKLAANKFNI